MRIAIGGISTESCTFSTLPTRLSDFVVHRGADLLDSGRYPFLGDLGPAMGDLLADTAGQCAAWWTSRFFRLQPAQR
jgi:hypothetical protein